MKLLKSIVTGQEWRQILQVEVFFYVTLITVYFLPTLAWKMDYLNKGITYETIDFYFIIFTQPLRSGRIWHKVSFISGV